MAEMMTGQLSNNDHKFNLVLLVFIKNSKRCSKAPHECLCVKLAHTHPFYSVKYSIWFYLVVQFNSAEAKQMRGDRHAA